MTRRGWLSAALGLAATGPARLRQADDDDTLRLEALEARGQAAGLGPFLVVERGLYLGTGDAPRGFQEEALRLCDALADDWLGHFRRRGLPAERPTRRLVVVILADPKGLANFLGIEPDPELRGLYDVKADWLAVCDNRGAGDPRAQRANTVALHHEATHQLCFHSGLLDRAADTPLLVSEGLGVYGEVRRPDGRTRVGAINTERLAVIGERARSGGALIPVAELVASDAWFDDPESRQLAYAQAWLLVHWLMQEAPRQARFASYLDALRGRRGGRRVEDLAAHLGDPSRLDADLKRHANRLLRR